MTPYDPSADYPIEVEEVEFRRTPQRTLLARIYRPSPPSGRGGPWPGVLDLHGGAWNNKDRLANEPMDRALAASGVVVVAIDLRLAGEAPYPAAVQDAHYGLRWMKSRAARWNIDPARVGLLGSSSGGHVAQLIGMRPNDPRYAALPLEGAGGIDASVRFVATRSPISDPLARFENAQRHGRSEMMQKSRTFFSPWDSITEGNPQAILDRGEPVILPPMLIMQGGEDDNVLPAFQQRFAEAYRAAGGDCELTVYEGCGHIWIENPGPQTDRAHAQIKAFVARVLGKGSAG
jgi:acetyl esterase/lipase